MVLRCSVVAVLLPPVVQATTGLRTMVEYTWEMPMDVVLQAADEKTFNIGLFTSCRHAAAEDPDNYGYFLGPILTRAAQLAWEQGAVLSPVAQRADFRTVLIWQDGCSIPAATNGLANCSAAYQTNAITRMMTGVGASDPPKPFPAPVAMIGGLNWTEVTTMAPASLGVPTVGPWSVLANLRFKFIYPTFLRTNPTQENILQAVFDTLRWLNFTKVDSLICDTPTGGDLEDWVKPVAAAAGFSLAIVMIRPMNDTYFPPDTVFAAEDPVEVAAARAMLLLRTGMEPTGQRQAAVAQRWSDSVQVLRQANAHSHISVLDFAVDAALCPFYDIMHYMSMNGLVGAGHLWLGQDPEIHKYDYDRGFRDPNSYLWTIHNQLPLQYGAKTPYAYEKAFDGYIFATPQTGDSSLMARFREWFATLEANKEFYFGEEIASKLTGSAWTALDSNPLYKHNEYVFDAMWAVLIGINNAILAYGYNFQLDWLLYQIWAQPRFDGMSGPLEFDSPWGNRKVVYSIFQYQIPMDAPGCDPPVAGGDTYAYSRCTALNCRDSTAEFLQAQSGGSVQNCAALLALESGNCSAHATQRLGGLEPGTRVADVCGASCPCRAVPPRGQVVPIGHHLTQDTLETSISITASMLVFHNGSLATPPNDDLPCPPGERYVRVTGVCEVCPSGTFTGNPGMTACEPCSPGSASSARGAQSCGACNVGKYSAAVGSLECSTCEPGRFGAQIQASACVDCGLGEYSGPAAVLCESCDIGRYADEPGSITCKMCPDKTTSQFTRSTSIDDCLCDRGFYKGEGAQVCLQCPSPDMTTPPKAIMEAQCYCPDGFFKDYYPNNYTCSGCPSAMTCALRSDMRFYEFFKASGNATYELDDLEGNVVPTTFPRLTVKQWSDPEDPLSVFTCSRDKACPGDIPGTCNDKLFGRACTKCPDGWVLTADGTGCIECAGYEQTGILFPVLPVVASPIVLSTMYFMFRDMPNAWGSWQNGVSCLVFMVISHYQVLTLILSVPIPWPQAAQDSWSVGSTTDDITVHLKIDCVGFNTLRTMMYARAAVPIGLAVISVVTYYVSQLTPYCIGRGKRMDVDRIFSVYMSLFFTFFNGIASMSMELFKCVDNPNGRRTLHTHRGELCYEQEWLSLLAVAVPCVFLYCLCSISLFMYIMFQAPVCFGDIRFQKRWKFLFIKFRPDIYWWSTVYLLKGVSLNFCFVIFSDGAFHLTWLVHVILVYLLLSLVFKPWRHATSNHFDVITHLVHCAVLFFAGMWAPTTDRLDKHLINWVIVVSFIPMPAGGLLMVNLFYEGAMHKFIASRWDFVRRILPEWLNKRLKPGALIGNMTEEQAEELMSCAHQMKKLEESDVKQLYESASDYDRLCILHTAKVVIAEFGIREQRPSSRPSLNLGHRVSLSRKQRDEMPSTTSLGTLVTPTATPRKKDDSPRSTKTVETGQQVPAAEANGNGNGDGHPPDYWTTPVEVDEGQHVPVRTPPSLTPRWSTSPR